jgi:hypothetical protein
MHRHHYAFGDSPSVNFTFHFTRGGSWLSYRHGHQRGPLVVPLPTEVPLKDAPLVRVIAQLRFPDSLSVGQRDSIAPFQEAIRAKYPVLRQTAVVRTAAESTHSVDRCSPGRPSPPDRVHGASRRRPLHRSASAVIRRPRYRRSRRPRLLWHRSRAAALRSPAEPTGPGLGHNCPADR